MNNHHEKWIATVIWSVLLATLVYTSGFAWQSGASNIIFRFSSSDLELIDWLGLLINGFMVVLIVLNWLRFADMSLDMLRSFAKDESPFAKMLIYPLTYTIDNEAEESDPDEAESTVVTSLLRNLGLVWSIIIFTPPLMAIIVRVVE